MKKISKSKWKSTHRDFRTGDPRKGTAMVLMYVETKGTCLVPVEVVADTEVVPEI